MPTYTLNIQIDDAGLQAITQSGQKVTIVKSVPRGGESVAWILFPPLEMNMITWTEEYSVYASTTNIQAGATIETQSLKCAAGGNMYPFENSQFKNGIRDLEPTQYGVQNLDPDIRTGPVAMITSGLYQGAMVNGEESVSPLNAIGVLYNENAIFTPIETIQVYLSLYQHNGQIISEVSSNALTVQFTNQTTQTIHFNDRTNTFAPGPLS